MIGTSAVNVSRRLLAAVLSAALVCGWAGLSPGTAALRVASTGVLRPIFGRLLGNPPVLRVDAVPDLYDGGYARINVYAENASVDGIRIDQTWIRLTGASFDPKALRQGVLRVLGLRGRAVYTRVSRANVEAYLDRVGPAKHITLTGTGQSITAQGTVSRQGVDLPVRLQGVFAAKDTPELFFHIERITVNSMPVPTMQIAQLERRINPVLDLRKWPVQFPIRVFRATAGGFVMSSLTDATSLCDRCGGPAPRDL